jgi:hypothetical protein
LANHRTISIPSGHSSTSTCVSPPR